MHWTWRGRVIRLRLLCPVFFQKRGLCASAVALVLGSCLLLLLHFLIVSETVDEAVYFSSLPIPAQPELLPLGITRMEELPTSGTPRMPKRIHQTWNTDQIPRSFVAWIRSWVEHHPDWEYWLWTDESARQLIKDRYPSLLPVFDGYPQNIQRADALRYLVLYEFGGIYADLDMESLRPLTPLVRHYACFVGQEPYAHPIIDTHSEQLVINALMACQQRHPFMKMVVDSLPDFAHMWSLLDATGPHFLTYVFNRYQRENPDLTPLDPNGTYLTPPEYFYPHRDPEKFKGFYQFCKKNYQVLDILQRRACQNLKNTLPEADRLALAFSRHHWSHTYFTRKVSLRQPVPIANIVPNVIIYS